MGKEDESTRKIFYPIVLGIVFDTKNKKILIGKRNPDEYLDKLRWTFIGGRPEHGEDLDEAVKREIKEETGLDVESLGIIFAKTYPEQKDLLALYYLCEVTGGKESPKGDLTELKWVAPEKLEENFTTSFHPHLKEYIMNLK